MGVILVKSKGINAAFNMLLIQHGFYFFVFYVAVFLGF